VSNVDPRRSRIDEQGRLRSADRESEIVSMALVDANGFAYYAPDELRDYYAENDVSYWGVFVESVRRHHDECLVTGQASLSDFDAGSGGASA
jgi:hypothetical protein